MCVCVKVLYVKFLYVKLCVYECVFVCVCVKLWYVRDGM